MGSNMVDSDMAETGYSRARRETRAAITGSWIFQVFAVVSTAMVTTGALLCLLIAGPHNIYVYAGIPTAVGIIWLAAILGALFIGWICFAPIRQRDEARTLVRDYLDRSLVINSLYLMNNNSGLRLSVTNKGATDIFAAQMVSIKVLDWEENHHPAHCVGTTVIARVARSCTEAMP